MDGDDVRGLVALQGTDLHAVGVDRSRVDDDRQSDGRDHDRDHQEDEPRRGVVVGTGDASDDRDHHEGERAGLSKLFHDYPLSRDVRCG